MNKSNKVIAKTEESERRSCASYLDDCFANYVGGAKVLLDTRQFNSEFNKLKIECIKDLGGAIRLDLSEDFGVTKKNLIEILEAIRISDFSKITDINRLYEIYHRIRG
jgi:hypothetical protein